MNEPTQTGDRGFAPPSIRDHLANERTGLAWLRTALTVIGLGFIVDRLAAETSAQGLMDIAGTGLVVLGGLVAAVGGYSYLAARQQMTTGNYRPQVALHLGIVAIVVVGAAVIAVYLVSA